MNITHFLFLILSYLGDLLQIVSLGFHEWVQCLTSTVFFGTRTNLAESYSILAMQ